MNTEVATICLPEQAELELEDIAVLIDAAKSSLAWRLIEIGRGLIAARALFDSAGDGGFIRWAMERCEISQSRAYECIQACEQFGNSTRLEKIQVSAIVCLSRDSTPQAARDETLRRLEDGESITNRDAKEIISRAKNGSNGSVDDGRLRLSDRSDDQEPPTRPDHRRRDEGAGGEADADDTADGDKIERSAQAPRASVRPFAHLAALPPDVDDAHQSYKLSCLRHKLAGWQDISRDDFIASLQSLIDLALAPPEGT